MNPDLIEMLRAVSRFALPNPRLEAKALARTVRTERDQIDALRLIRITAEQRAVLRRMARGSAGLKRFVERAIAFREKVEREFVAAARAAA